MHIDRHQSAPLGMKGLLFCLCLSSLPSPLVFRTFLDIVFPSKLNFNETIVAISAVQNRITFKAGRIPVPKQHPCPKVYSVTLDNSSAGTIEIVAGYVEFEDFQAVHLAQGINKSIRHTRSQSLGITLDTRPMLCRD